MACGSDYLRNHRYWTQTTEDRMKCITIAYEILCSVLAALESIIARRRPK
jgi:hypothetical protein